MKRHGFAIIMAALFFIAAAPKEEKGPSDLDRLQGHWLTKSFLIDGGPLPEAKQYPDRVMTIKDGTFSEFRGGKVAVRGTIKLDPTKSPKWLDATFTEGGPTGETVLGIYQLDGDTLKVCVSTPETERPAKFASTSGTKLRLIVYERKQP